MDQPLFDSTAAALKFALNYSVDLAPPSMSRMMSDVKRELAPGVPAEEPTPGGRRKSPRPRLKGLEGAAQAGMIARHLDDLTAPQKDCILAQYTNWVTPCSCRNPCCSTYRRNPTWNKSIESLCAHLRDHAELSKVKGRKGMSTPPRMRRALVERFFVPTKTMILADLAEQCHVTPQTVINHKKPIEEYLQRTLNQAVSTLDQILNQLGIVGRID